MKKNIYNTSLSDPDGDYDRDIRSVNVIQFYNEYITKVKWNEDRIIWDLG
jgi:hypothetical protein